MNLGRYVPHIRYNPPATGTHDEFSTTWDLTDKLFRFVGWCIVLGTLHFGYVKTQSVYFALPDLGLSGILAFLAYTFFTRFTVAFGQNAPVVFHTGRPRLFHWPSLIAMAIVMMTVREVIQHWVAVVASLQTK